MWRENFELGKSRKRREQSNFRPKQGFQQTKLACEPARLGSAYGLDFARAQLQQGPICLYEI